MGDSGPEPDSSPVSPSDDRGGSVVDKVRGRESRTDVDEESPASGYPGGDPSQSRWDADELRQG